MSGDWNRTIRLNEIGRGLTLTLAPDGATRASLARQLDLKGLPAFSAEVTLKPWLDGVEVTGRFKAVVEQVCGLSLEPFEQPLEGVIEVRAVPPGSTMGAPEGDEIELDPDAPDPPDVLDGDAIDVAAYVVEHLALEIDPFPRKPGASFDYMPPETEESPFSVLKKLKDPKR